jgi:hypothetical protein
LKIFLALFPEKSIQCSQIHSFAKFFQKLKELELQDLVLQNVLIADSYNHQYPEANTNFLIEETVVAYVIREGFIELPKTLVKADAYQWNRDDGVDFHNFLRTISSENPVLPQILQFFLMLLKARLPECWSTLLVLLLASSFHPSRDLRLAS